MSDEHTETGTGWPQREGPVRPPGPGGAPAPDVSNADGSSLLGGESGSAGVVPGERSGEPAGADGGDTVRLPLAPVTEPVAEPVTEPPAERPDDSGPAQAALAGGRSRLSSAGLIIAVLLALLGFTLVVQLKTTSADPTLTATRQEDLVRILSDLESRESRLRQDIAALEESQRQLASGARGREAALEEATRRADELGILAGTLPAVGPGLRVRFESGGKPVVAGRILDAVQELRGAGAEAMQISGADGSAMRIIASTYFVDAEDGDLVVDGRRLSGPYTITVIGDPATMRTALNIPGGVAASVRGDGGTVIVEEDDAAEVSSLHAPIDLKHARPVS